MTPASAPAMKDYITKPFEPVEVLARVRSQLRRYTMLGSQNSAPDVITIGAVTLDDPTKSVTVDGEPVYLTPSEYNILRHLMQNPGKVFSSAQIYQAVWNETGTGSESAVAVHIRHLRHSRRYDQSCGKADEIRAAENRTHHQCLP